MHKPRGWNREALNRLRDSSAQRIGRTQHNPARLIDNVEKRAGLSYRLRKTRGRLFYKNKA